MNSQTEHERRREIVRAFSDPEVADRWEHFAPDFKWRIIGTTPISGVLIGRAGIAHTIGPFGARMAKLRVYVDDVIGEGDRFVKIAHSEGEMADGRPYRNDYATVFIFDGDKVVEGIEYLDTELVNTVFEIPDSALKPAEANAPD